MSSSSICQKLILALAAEGTPAEAGAIQHNLPVVLQEDFVCAVDGYPVIPRMKEAGPVVVSLSHELPYAPGTFDEIIVNGAPVCHGCGDQGQYCEMPPSSFLGPVHCVVQLLSLLREGGKLNIGGECWVRRNDDGGIRHESCFL